MRMHGDTRCRAAGSGRGVVPVRGGVEPVAGHRAPVRGVPGGVGVRLDGARCWLAHPAAMGAVGGRELRPHTPPRCAGGRGRGGRLRRTRPRSPWRRRRARWRPATSRTQPARGGLVLDVPGQDVGDRAPHRGRRRPRLSVCGCVSHPSTAGSPASGWSRPSRSHPAVHRRASPRPLPSKLSTSASAPPHAPSEEPHPTHTAPYSGALTGEIPAAIPGWRARRAVDRFDPRL